MQRRRICILTGNDLCHNPRVIKEATTLAGAAYEVEVLGAFMNTELKAKDESLLKGVDFNFRSVIDLTRKQSALSRAQPRLGRLLHRVVGIENAWQLGAASAALSRVARKTRADLFIAHSEAGICALAELSSPDRRLAVDMEDWFSEDLLPEARRDRPLKTLRRAEQNALRNAAYASCTSHVLAEALAREYGCNPPVVIYNAFAWSDREKIDGLTKDRKDKSLPSIHWYSQTLGRGRGLEDLIAALPLIDHAAEVHLRGEPAAGFVDWISTQLPPKWRNRVFVHNVVPNEELLSRIAEHDIGFAGEQKYCRSRDLTVTNKILHYLLGGLAVVASDTAGQLEIAKAAPGAVFTYRAGNPEDLARRFDPLLAASHELAVAKQAALDAARKTFCWEKQAPKLLTSIERVFTV